MAEDRSKRERLLRLVERIRNARETGQQDTEALAEFEQIQPGTDVSNLCDSDFDDETITDICLGDRDIKRVCTRAELLDLVRKLQSTTAGSFDTEAGAIQAVRRFNYNCRHPAGSDLIFFAEEHFGGRSYPTPEEIVEKALRDE